MANKRKTYPVEFEWNFVGREGNVAKRCWNKPFWYGTGEPATEPSIIIRKSDYDAMLRDARELHRRERAGRNDDARRREMAAPRKPSRRDK